MPFRLFARRRASDPDDHVSPLASGLHVAVRGVEALLDDQPDYCLILAWNFTDEIVEQQAEYRARGGRFIRPVPHPEVLM